MVINKSVLYKVQKEVNNLLSKNLRKRTQWGIQRSTWKYPHLFTTTSQPVLSHSSRMAFHSHLKLWFYVHHFIKDLSPSFLSPTKTTLTKPITHSPYKSDILLLTPKLSLSISPLTPPVIHWQFSIKKMISKQ